MAAPSSRTGRTSRLPERGSPGVNRTGAWHHVLSVSASSIGPPDPDATPTDSASTRSGSVEGAAAGSVHGNSNGTGAAAPRRPTLKAGPITFIAPAPPPARAAVDRSLARLQRLFARLDDHREQADRASHQLQERLRVAADLLRALHGQTERVDTARETVETLQNEATTAVARLSAATAQLEFIEQRIARRLGDLDAIHARLTLAEDRARDIERMVEQAEVNAAAMRGRGKGTE